MTIAPYRMTASELKAILTKARVTQKRFGKTCGVTERQVGRWVSGETEIPLSIALLARILTFDVTLAPRESRR